jgi:hypothetical protein
MSRPLPAEGPRSLPSERLIIREQRLPPTRGLIVAHNRAVRPMRVIDLQRWIRLSRHSYQADKIDVLANGDAAAVLEDLLPAAAAIDVRLSLRTDGAIPPYRLDALKRLGLFDVHLCPDRFDLDAIRPWLASCRDLRLPVRLRVPVAPVPGAPPELTADALADSGVCRVDFSTWDPFAARGAIASQSHEILRWMQSAAAALEARDVEANLLYVPFCFLEASSWTRVAGTRQRAVDHAGYVPESERLARRIFGAGPVAAGMIIRILLSNATLYRQPADNILLPGLIKRNYAYLFSRIYRRLTIHLRLAHSVPKPAPYTAYESALAESRAFDATALPVPCRACSLQRICDHVSHESVAALPGLSASPVEGDHVVSPLHFAARQPKYYDELDAERLHAEETRADLVGEALNIITNRPPDIQIGPHDYAVEETHFDRMESGLKWWSVSNAERLSTPLGEFSPPLTISVDFGAGIADFVGFHLGRHCRLVCPMEAYRHNVTLHVAADGRYILLRDRIPVRPAEFEGHYYLPARLAERVQPRIAAWNIDECIATQNVRIWTGEAPRPRPKPKYSVIIVSTRFTRRLHAVLRSLAHQRGFDMNAAEIIVNYVPGIDATDDLIDSVSLTYPSLHIIRNPFPERFINSKGFLINEAAKIAAGEWIMLLDSDTLVPPDYFAKVDAASATAEFIAPDGRKLLPKDLTARILMGEIDPWDQWPDLISGAGEFRHRETFGIPVGFCQTFRAKYLQMFPYMEVDHFETADMRFGGEMKNHLGEETRLSGTPVLHLDHGGSQWYGTQKHL